MNRLSRALAVSCLFAGAAAAQTGTARIVRAANRFLATLTEAQKKSVLFAFDDAAAAREVVEPAGADGRRGRDSRWAS